MKKKQFMDIIPKTKKVIRYCAAIYAFFIILFTIVLKHYQTFDDLSLFAQFMYITMILLAILSVSLYFIDEVKGAILSIAIILIYNIPALFVQSIKDLDIRINLLFVSGAVILFLHYFEKAIQSERVDYQILLSKYNQLDLNSKITKTISDITPRMLINDDLDELLQIILEKAVELIPKAQSGSILIRNNGDMEFHAAVGYDLGELRKIKLKFEEMYQYRLNMLYEPAVIKDIKTFNKKNLNAETNTSMNEKDMLTAKAVLTCSFILHGKIYGFINLDNLDDLDAFNEQDKIYIKHLASQIELALNNHILVDEIYTLSKTDSLTGVHSRKHYEKLIKNTYNDALEKKKVFSIAVMDVNYLKKINDTYGHMVGDEYLIHFVEIIKENLKPQDILSRTGGDEFVIIFPEQDLHQSLDRIKEIRQTFAKKPFTFEDLEHIVDFGCGIACYPVDNEDLLGLMRIADKRMYDNKRERKLTK